MARRKNSKPFRDEEPSMNISPLIDVAFLLLIYFLVTTTLEPQEADLSLLLPGVATTESDPNDRALPNLTDRLQRYAAAASNAGSEAMVIVDCADEVPEQRFIDVLNACADNGLQNISLVQ